ncbi:MAG: aminomethyl-transferring glycine dehydrogenase subunit GcvPA [Candidatus Korarchaeota archaeon]|nr:aminomethyl-transferring glycine dehydrogenase subunit GcvPA [Candidatus Korarchaeota archaeon]
MPMPAESLIPNASGLITSKMMNYLGINKLEDLFSDVPDSILINEPTGIGRSLTQSEVEALYSEKLEKNISFKLSFMGGGIADHYVPPLVDELVTNQEFYSSYTPYQPEISQGILQALFEYQSLMAELLGMDVVNASLYDYASALGEAGRFSVRVTKRKKILLATTTHPERKAVLKTYMEPLDVQIVEINREASGEISFDELSASMDENVGMVYLETPNFFGVVERGIEDVADIAHSKGALLVVGTDPLLAGIVKPPGELGADVVIGEGQHLGGYMSYGGPSLGIFAVRRSFRHIRQLPGRLIGMTKTVDRRYRGYTMVLQTREQHIRQEEATSNITTNSSLMAVRAAIYLALLGPDGIRSVAEKILYNTEYLKRKLSDLPCFSVLFENSLHFKEIPVVSEIPWGEVNSWLLRNGILGAFQVSKLFPDADSTGKLGLLSTTEKHRLADLDLLLRLMEEVCS